MAAWPTLYQIHRISIRGGIGTGLFMALVVAGVAEALPALRRPLLVSMAVGVLVAGAWIRSRRNRPLDARTPPLSLGLSEARRRPR
jgi:hypothetical protein